jgi:hypothetical protein
MCCPLPWSRNGPATPTTTPPLSGPPVAVALPRHPQHQDRHQQQQEGLVVAVAALAGVGMLPVVAGQEHQRQQQVAGLPGMWQWALSSSCCRMPHPCSSPGMGQQQLLQG